MSGRTISIPRSSIRRPAPCCPTASRGELVFTSLTKEGMPVVRYRTRDLTRLLPGTARTMRRMEKVTGRADDMMIVRGVNLFPTQIEELILEDRRLAPHFMIELRRAGRLDAMAVKVEARGDAADAATRDRSAPRPRAAHQGAHRHHRRGRDGGARHDRALGRQGTADHRPAGGVKGHPLRCCAFQLRSILAMRAGLKWHSACSLA